MLSIFIAPAVYDGAQTVLTEARRLVEFVKASPPADSSRPVLGPGDAERRMRAERRLRGVPLDDKTMADLLAAADFVGVGEERVRAMLQ